MFSRIIEFYNSSMLYFFVFKYDIMLPFFIFAQ